MSRGRRRGGDARTRTASRHAAAATRGRAAATRGRRHGREAPAVASRSGGAVVELRRRYEETYYADDDVNYWADDYDFGDEDALTFSSEKTTLSGAGYAFGDLRIKDVAADYRFPVSYVADCVAGFGVAPPISDDARVRDLLDADQAFALLEAVTSLDAAEVDDAYVDFGLDVAAARLEAELSEVFGLCVAKGFALPHGVATRLRASQYGALREALGWSAASDERPTRTYEDFGYRPLDETAEPLDPTARAMQDYVQDADRPTYLDGN